MSFVKLTRKYKDSSTSEVLVAVEQIVSVEFVPRFQSTAVHTVNDTVWVIEHPERFFEQTFTIGAEHLVQ